MAKLSFNADDISLLAYSLLPYLLPSCARKISTGLNSVKEGTSGQNKGATRARLQLPGVTGSRLGIAGSSSDEENEQRPVAQKPRRARTVKASNSDARDSLILFRSVRILYKILRSVVLYVYRIFCPYFFNIFCFDTLFRKIPTSRIF